MYVDQMVACTQRILRGDALKKYKTFLLECKQLAKYLAGYGWALGDLKELSTDDFWNWAKSDGIGYNGYTYLRLDKCVYF